MIDRTGDVVGEVGTKGPSFARVATVAFALIISASTSWVTLQGLLLPIPWTFHSSKPFGLARIASAMNDGEEVVVLL